MRKTYRRLPIAFEHLQFAVVAFKWQDTYLHSEQYGMVLKGSASNHALHRLRLFLRAVLRGLFRAPVGRFVEDLIAASRRGFK